MGMAITNPTSPSSSGGKKLNVFHCLALMLSLSFLVYCCVSLLLPAALLDRGDDIPIPAARRKETSLFLDPVSGSVVDTCNDYSNDCVACNERPLPEGCMWVFLTSEFAAGSTVAEAGSTDTPGGACRTRGPPLYGGEAQLQIPQGSNAAVECNTAGQETGPTPGELNTRCQEWAADPGNNCLFTDCGTTGFCCGFQGWTDSPPSTLPGVCVFGQPQYCLYDANAGACLPASFLG